MVDKTNNCLVNIITKCLASIQKGDLDNLRKLHITPEVINIIRYSFIIYLMSHLFQVRLAFDAVADAVHSECPQPEDGQKGERKNLEDLLTFAGIRERVPAPALTWIVGKETR